MKKRVIAFVFAAAALAIQGARAQAPAGSTGQCKDGTYTSAAKKDGACRGHKGVQTWMASTAAPAAAKPAAAPVAAAAAPTPVAAPAPAAAAPAYAAKPSAASTGARKSPGAEAASRAQAPGGGPGMVWVNTSTKVYHCPGTEFYGKTKEGKYMSEADAKSAGAHADHNNACTK